MEAARHFQTVELEENQSFTANTFTFPSETELSPQLLHSQTVHSSTDKILFSLVPQREEAYTSHFPAPSWTATLLFFSLQRITRVLFYEYRLLDYAMLENCALDGLKAVLWVKCSNVLNVFEAGTKG